MGITESGVSEIAAGIRANSTLKELDLRNNKITPEGAHILAAALKSNDTLQSIGMIIICYNSLDIRWNTIHVSGGRYFLEVLRDNYTLVQLLIAGNEVDYNTLHELDQLINRNKELRTVKEKEKMMQEKLSSEMYNVHDLQSVWFYCFLIV